MKMPVWFVGHGSPMEALEGGPWQEALRVRFTALLEEAKQAGTPVRALLFVSAHWTTARDAALTSAPAPRTLHDFSGFPAELYALRHDAPGDPALASRTSRMLRDAGFTSTLDAERPRDHGVWIPARAFDPEARLPVLQLALPDALGDEALVRLGGVLAPLRAEGVFIIASGNLTHNLRDLDWRNPDAAPAPWAVAFESWVLRALSEQDTDALVQWRARAPGATRAHPTAEHFLPLLVAAGAGLTQSGKASTLYRGMRHGTLSMTSVAFD